jgi:hypothetical protein
MRISAFSSNLRSLAAHDAPPATPPTIIVFTAFSSFLKTRKRFQCALPIQDQSTGTGEIQSKAHFNGKAKFICSLLDSSGNISAEFLIAYYATLDQVTSCPKSGKKVVFFNQNRIV